MDEPQNMRSPIQVFYSYALEDEEYRLQLEKHLSLLRRQNAISEWHKHKIVPGDDRMQAVADNLNTSSIILLLISPDFMASDYCYQNEMQHALQLQASGSAYVIPIILRPVDWQDAPFSNLPCLPRDGRPVTQWSNRDEAFYDIVVGIRETIDAINTAQRSTSDTLPPLRFKQRAIQKTTTHAEQNRQRFLKRVRTTWIIGLLEQSLHNATLLMPALQEQPDALLNPWRLIIQEMDQRSRPSSSDLPIIQVYDDANGELLILGEPGAGKTTLLLQLARDLIIRAEQDTSLSLPVVLNLSSWTQKRSPLSSWLIDELREKYSVPRKLATTWLANNKLILLLDGLDEVIASHRSACIMALNQYQQEHSLTSIVVCSRSSEYRTQVARLSLQKAVSIQPLTLQQIDTYLSSAGAQLSNIRSALQNDPDLRELAATPLMLNVLMLTYQDEEFNDLSATYLSNEYRKQIFALYIQRMLKRRGYKKHYSYHQTICWLTSLANQMKLHGQTEFYIERLQRDWLINWKLRLLYRTSSAVICFLIGALISLIIAGLSIGLTIGFLSALGLGMATGLVAGLNPPIRTTKAFIWSWRTVRIHWPLLIMLTLTCLVLGALDVNEKYIVLSATTGAFFGMLVGVFFMVLVNGELSLVMPDTRHITLPNQEIKRSADHALLVMLACVPFEVIFILLNNRMGILGVIGLGLLIALSFGGLACIQHVILRFLLWRSGLLPWRLPQFLDYAAERILLRKVGGGYMFVHQLLLEHFATLDREEDD